MKKNGFTIIELVVGVGLLSIVTVFMLAIIIDLRDTEQANGIDTKALIMQAIIVKTINNDLIRYSEAKMAVERNDLKADSTSETAEKAKISIQLGDKSKFISLYNNSDSAACPANSAQSFVYYSEKEGTGLDLSDTGNIDTIIDSTSVELRKSLPAGYCFTDVSVTNMGISDPSHNIFPNGQKLVINVINVNDPKMNFNIEGYFYNYKDTTVSG